MKFGALDENGRVISRKPCGEIPLDPSQYAKEGDPEWETLKEKALRPESSIWERILELDEEIERLTKERDRLYKILLRKNQ